MPSHPPIDNGIKRGLRPVDASRHWTGFYVCKLATPHCLLTDSRSCLSPASWIRLSTGMHLLLRRFRVSVLLSTACIQSNTDSAHVTPERRTVSNTTRIPENHELMSRSRRRQVEENTLASKSKSWPLRLSRALYPGNSRRPRPGISQLSALFANVGGIERLRPPWRRAQQRLHRDHCSADTLCRDSATLVWQAPRDCARTHYKIIAFEEKGLQFAKDC